VILLVRRQENHRKANGQIERLRKELEMTRLLYECEHAAVVQMLNSEDFEVQKIKKEPDK
jgi:hypothetical protein